MSWTGTQPPARVVVKTTYEHGQLVREQTEAHGAGGGITITDIRCTCQYPEAGCTLHGKEKPL